MWSYVWSELFCRTQELQERLQLERRYSFNFGLVYTWKGQISLVVVLMLVMLMSDHLRHRNKSKQILSVKQRNVAPSIAVERERERVLPATVIRLPGASVEVHCQFNHAKAKLSAQSEAMQKMRRSITNTAKVFSVRRHFELFC